jgi:hypothetical protein
MCLVAMSDLDGSRWMQAPYVRSRWRGTERSTIARARSSSVERCKGAGGTVPRWLARLIRQVFEEDGPCAGECHVEFVHNGALLPD